MNISMVYNKTNNGSSASMCHGTSLSKSILNVALQMEHAVGSTMGPKGHTVIIAATNTITKDGVKVAKHIKFPNEAEATIAKIMQSSAQATNQTAGDGTTSTIAILKAALELGFQKICNEKISPMGLRNGIEAATAKVVETLKNNAKEVKDVSAVATVSANGDKVVGATIAKILDEIGKDGVITVESGNSYHPVSYEIIQGYSFTKGPVSPLLIAGLEKNKIEFEKPLIFLINEKISSHIPLMHMLTKAAETGRPVVFIAEDIDNDALTFLLLNSKMRGIKVCGVKAPGFGGKRQDLLEDIADVIGAKVIGSENAGAITLDQYIGFSERGEPFDSEEPFSILSVAGECKKIIIEKDSTIITDGKGDESAIQKRIEFLKTEIKNAQGNSYEKENLEERLAKITGGIAVLKAGGVTDVEVKERKDRYEDALNATKAALEEGILPGGGIALYLVREEINKMMFQTKDKDERAGMEVVYNSLLAPLFRISKNAGAIGSMIVQKLEESKNKNLVFDARTGEIVDYNDAGIVDPCKVVRIAFENALKLAAVLLTTDTLLYEERKKDDSSNPYGKYPMDDM